MQLLLPMCAPEAAHAETPVPGLFASVPLSEIVLLMMVPCRCIQATVPPWGRSAACAGAPGI
jgi:hypothetical protein